MNTSTIPPSAMAGATPIRVMIVDDHPSLRRGIRALIDAHAPKFEVVAKAGSAVDALNQLDAARPHVVLTDLNMTPTGGIELIGRLRALRRDLQFVVLTVSADNEHIRAAYDAGALGFVSKEAEEGDVVRAIEAVMRGSVHYPAGLRDALRTEKPGATPREREVLGCIAENLTNKQIARRLGIGERAVETHRANIMRKFGLATTPQLIGFAKDGRWK